MVFWLLIVWVCLCVFVVIAKRLYLFDYCLKCLWLSVWFACGLFVVPVIAYFELLFGWDCGLDLQLFCCWCFGYFSLV